MVMNVVPLEHGYLNVRLEGTQDTIDAFIYDMIFSLNRASMVTATDTRNSIDDTEDCRETSFLLRIDMDDSKSTDVA